MIMVKMMVVMILVTVMSIHAVGDLLGVRHVHFFFSNDGVDDKGGGSDDHGNIDDVGDLGNDELTHAVGDLLGVHVVAPSELSLVAAPSSHLTNMITIMTIGIIMRMSMMMAGIFNIVIIMMILLLMTITSGGAPRPKHCGENEISFTPNLVGSER